MKSIYYIIWYVLQQGIYKLSTSYQDLLAENLIDLSYTDMDALDEYESILIAFLDVYFFKDEENGKAFLRKIKLNEYLYEKCLKQIKYFFYKEAKYYSLEELVAHFDLLQNKLKIKSIADFVINVLENNLIPCKDLLIYFLSGNDRLYFSQIDKTVITVEMIKFLLRPEDIDQKDRNLCGPAAVLYLLLTYSPERCIEAFIELLHKGRSTSLISLKASYASIYFDKSFPDIFMNAAKHASNHLIGYSPAFFNQSLEAFAGITEPSVIDKWLKNADFVNVQDAIDLNYNQPGLKWYHKALTTNGVYSKDHVQFSSSLESFETALVHSAEKKTHIMLITLKLSCLLTNQEYKPKNINILNLPLDHYIVVHRLQKLDEHRIKLDFWTWGKKYSEEILLDDFLEGYKGFITSQPPINQLELNSQP